MKRRSPSVMDSGRPDVCSTLETGADCIGGLDSILQHVRRGNRHLKTISGLSLEQFIFSKKAEAQIHAGLDARLDLPNKSYDENKLMFPPRLLFFIIPTALSPVTLAYLNVSSDPLRSQFPTGPVDSHSAGNAAVSSTELTEAEQK